MGNKVDTNHPAERAGDAALSARELAEVDVEDVVADEQATPQDREDSRLRERQVGNGPI